MENYAEQTVLSTIELILNPMVRDLLIAEVKEKKILDHKHRPGMTTLLINYDEKLASECSANPWNRKAPARPAYLELVRAFIEEFGIQVGVLLLYSDHGKGSLERAFAKMVDTAIDPVKASHMVYDVWFDEDSYRERCKFKRGTQVEAKECLHVAYMGASLPVNKRKYYPGSNHGRHWGMLVLDPVCKCLQVPHDGKKKLYYGSSMRPGGGPPDDEQIDAPDGSSGETITANTMVPFCWRSYPLRFSQDMVKSFNATHIHSRQRRFGFGAPLGG